MATLVKIWNKLVSCLWLGNTNKVHPLPTTATMWK